MTLEPTDQFVVQRDGAMKKVESQNLQASLEDTDLMVVARGTTPFKATGKEIKDSLAPADLPPTINGISLVGGPGFSGKSYVTTLNAFDGIPTASKTMKAKVTGELSIAGETSPITGVGTTDYVSMCTGTPQANQPISNAFDGNTATYTAPDSGEIVFTPTSPLAGDFRIYCAGVPGQNGQLKVNNIVQGLEYNTPTGGWQTFRNGAVGPVTSIAWDRNAYVYAIEIAGQILIDGRTILTLTDRTNLDNGAFVVGDVVTGYTQDGPPAAFAPVIYTGNSGTQDINCGFAPDLVWIKDRTASGSHFIFDTIRGTNKAIFSDGTFKESDYSADDNTLTAFNANGFTIGNRAEINTSSNDYVAWCWKASGSTVTNDAGTIESQVRAGNGFSIIKVDQFSAAGTIGHGLGTTPAMWIWKPISEVDQWYVWHKELSINSFIILNQSSAVTTPAPGPWDNTAPTDTVLSTGDTWLNFGDQLIYAWAETPGVSSFGKYTGNSSTSNPVNLGFEPAYVMVKHATGTGPWVIVDNQRSKELYANTSDDETVDNRIAFTSTGFDLISGASDTNANGGTYIYAAFAAGDPPVTVEAISTTADEMTVSGGNWENGQTVKNTVVNPITDVPVSDEITGVTETSESTWNQTEDWADGTTTGTAYSAAYDWDKFFNGELSGLGPQSSSSSVFYTLTLTDRIRNVTQASFFTDSASLTDGRDIGFQVNGIDINGSNCTRITNSIPYEYQLDSSFTSIESWGNKQTFNPFGFKVNGKLLVTPGVPGADVIEETTLTLASDSGLGNFAPGYDVYQDSGYTAETSAITNVDPTALVNLVDQLSLGSQVSENQYGNNELYCFDGSVVGSSSQLGYGSWNTSAADNPNARVTFTIPDGMSGPIYLATDAGTSAYINGTIKAQTFDTNVPKYLDDVQPGDEVSVWRDTIINIYGFYQIPDPMEGNKLGPTFGGGATLTLTDSTDLDVFEPGDNVGGPDIGVILTIESVTLSGVPLTQHNVNGADAQTAIVVGETLTTPGGASAVVHSVGNRSGTPPAATAWWRYVTGSETGTFNIGDQVIAPAGPPVKVVSVDADNNQMTVDGGTWSNGDTVSADIPAATGTVGSTSGSEMTLSASDGRWIANRGKYVTGDATPLVSRSVFLEFTGSTVNGTAPSDPGFTPAPANLTLSFNDADNPSGRTWDQDFPAGTKIETRVLLTNPSAPNGVDSGWSNQVTARQLSTDLSPEELQQAYAETAASLLSHKNRGDYRTGQDALEKRADLRIKMAELGLTKDQIKELGLE